MIGKSIPQPTIHTPSLTELQRQQLSKDELEHLGDDYNRRRSRHRDPTSTFVLPEITRRVPVSEGDAVSAKILQGLQPEAADDPEFYWVNSEAEYNETPVDSWMEDPQGNVARKVFGSKSHPIIVYSQEEEDKLPIGTWVASQGEACIEEKGYPGTFQWQDTLRGR